SFERKDGIAVLDGNDSACGERAAVADAIDFIDHGSGGVARPHEKAVQRGHIAIRLHSAGRRDQRLGEGLAPAYALPALLGAATTIQIVFELLEVENGEKLLHGG